MKKIAVLTGLIALTINLWSQQSTVKALVEKYQGQEGYTYVYITEYMFQLAGTFVAEEDPETKDLLNNLKSLIVISASAEVNAKRSVRFADEINNTIPKSTYKVLMKVKEDDEDVDILANETEGVIHELILTVKSPDEDLLLILTGNIDLKSITKLSHTMNIEGLNNLEHLNESNTN